ncbi:MAG: hypothetical protein RIR18_1913 [Pseudomonadota bacterium]|jgi:hypothetical protein
MATDRTEAVRRGKSPPKTTTKHPYAAIEHRVIDSEAYANLTFSARSLLVLIARQLSKDNNGHLQATFSYLHRFGFDSERTLARGIAELIAHGMIYRTRSGGYQQGPSKYAVTWLPITSNREGLFLDSFKPCAWRDWKPEKNKTPPAKMQSTSFTFGTLTPFSHAKNTAISGAKNEDIELMPCRGVKARHEQRVGRPRKLMTSPLAIRLSLTNDRGHLRLIA